MLGSKRQLWRRLRQLTSHGLPTNTRNTGSNALSNTKKKCEKEPMIKPWRDIGRKQWHWNPRRLSSHTVRKFTKKYGRNLNLRLRLR